MFLPFKGTTVGDPPCYQILFCRQFIILEVSTRTTIVMPSAEIFLLITCAHILDYFVRMLIIF